MLIQYHDKLRVVETSAQKGKAGEHALKLELDRVRLEQQKQMDALGREHEDDLSRAKSDLAAQ